MMRNPAKRNRRRNQTRAKAKGAAMPQTMMMFDETWIALMMPKALEM